MCVCVPGNPSKNNLKLVGSVAGQRRPESEAWEER